MAVRWIQTPGDTRHKPAQPVLQRGHPLARNLVSAWTFHERGGDPRDLMGYGNIADASDASVVWSNEGGGTLEPGDNGLPVSGNIDRFNMNGKTWTCAVRVKIANQTGSRGQVFAAWGNTSPWKGWSVVIGGAEIPETWDGTSYKAYGTALTEGQWYTIVYRQYLTAGAKDVWVDGAFHDSDTTSHPAITPTEARVQIGSADGGAQEFDGKIQWIYVWDRAITPAEIRLLYEQPHVLITPRRHVPVGTAAAAAGNINPIFSGDGIHSQTLWAA